MKSLKLNKIVANRLSNELMNAIKGGTAPSCACGCCYVNNGGSSTTDNMIANYDGGLHSPCPPKEIIL